MTVANYIMDLRKKVGHDRLLFVGTGVIVYKDGKVLLQKRRDNGLWASHGGAAEIGEYLEDAARRELYEETGLIAGCLELLDIFSGPEGLYTYPNGDDVYVIGACYICRDFSGEINPQAEEVVALEWFEWDNLPGDEEISPLDRRYFKAFKEKFGEKNKPISNDT